MSLKQSKQNKSKDRIKLVHAILLSYVITFTVYYILTLKITVS